MTILSALMIWEHRHQRAKLIGFGVSLIMGIYVLGHWFELY